VSDTCSKRGATSQLEAGVRHQRPAHETRGLTECLDARPVLVHRGRRPLPAAGSTRRRLCDGRAHRRVRDGRELRGSRAGRRVRRASRGSRSRCASGGDPGGPCAHARRTAGRAPAVHVPLALRDARGAHEDRRSPGGGNRLGARADRARDVRPRCARRRRGARHPVRAARLRQAAAAGVPRRRCLHHRRALARDRARARSAERRLPRTVRRHLSPQPAGREATRRHRRRAAPAGDGHGRRRRVARASTSAVRRST
jgi:hypothetical protein